MAQTTERAFETYVMQMLAAKGWQRGSVSAWDKELALFPDQVTAFIAETQPKLWADMRTLHADQLESMLAKALVKELAIKGCLHVLRHGFKFYGKIFSDGLFQAGPWSQSGNAGPLCVQWTDRYTPGSLLSRRPEYHGPGLCPERSCRWPPAS